MSTFPQPFLSTVSHWQADNRGSTSLYLHGAEAPLPAEADIVLIGAGAMGSALSYFLTRPGALGEGKRVVCVEAKDVASGASGRNGGHVGPKTSELCFELQKPVPAGAGVSEEEAVKIIESEKVNFDLVAEIVKKEGMDVDFWAGEICETHISAEVTKPAKERYEKWLALREKYGLTHEHQTTFIDDPAKAKEISRFAAAESLQLRPGGSVQSHKFTTELMRCAIESTLSDFTFHSWTPVDAVEPSPSQDAWVVKTAKGDILAGKVVLCTNAHTKNFFPDSDPICTHINPRLAQCSLITPPPSFSGAQGFKHTYNVSDRFYFVQTRGGGIVMGGGEVTLANAGLVSFGETIGETDDSKLMPAFTAEFEKYCREHFIGWDKEAHGEGLTRTWSGILTWVKDWLPVVGEVPGKKGLFVSAGFHGHGMSRIFLTAKALASTLETGEWDPILPESFKYTAERLDRCKDLGLEFGSYARGDRAD